MKNFILLLVCTGLLQAELSVESIKNMVNSIHKKREGIDLSTLENTVEPFIEVQIDNNNSIISIPNVKKNDIKLKLHAIMNGKAFIDDSWVKVNDEIRGYTLKYIGSKGVVLRNKNSIKKLFLQRKKNNFIKIEERN